MSARKDKGKRERYVVLRYWLLDSAAWKCLPVGPRALYVEIAKRYNGSNNGRIPYSVREAMMALGISKGQAKYLFDMLLDRGFIIYTSKGAFSLKTERDATEWRLTEYASDYPPAHATKEFMRWNGDFETVSKFRERKGERRPKMTDADKERARRFQNKTRFTAMNRTVHSNEPHGSQQKTVKPKKRSNGSQQKTVDAQNDPPTVHSDEHLQLPGRGCEPGVLLPSPEGEPAEKKPWSMPTVEEVPWDTLPTELRMLVLGLPGPELDYYGCTARASLDAAYQAATEKQPDAAPDQAKREAIAETAQPTAFGTDNGRVTDNQPVEKAPPAPPDQPASAPDPVSAPTPRPMSEGDRIRAERRAREQEMLRKTDPVARAVYEAQRPEAAMKERLH